MHLIVRPMRPGDLDECAHLPLLDEAAYDPATRAALPRFWRALLTTGYTEAIVVEDLDRPAPRRIGGFAFIVFLTDEFLADAAGPDAPPYLNRRIVEAWQADRSPLLCREGVRRANSGPGVVMHTAHESFPIPPDPTYRLYLEKAIEAFLHLLAGYRLRETTIEVYGREQMQWNLNGGFRLRTDYAGYYRQHPQTPPPPPGLEPYLIGLDRTEAAAMPGTTVSMVFTYTPPRIFFTSAEQEVLRGALLDYTEEEIAADLCLSAAGIRKRWLGLYARAECRMPGLLPESPETDRGRGTEKRRRLLAYLRAHPEELRPHLPLK